jgi:hypothetical protein
MRKGIGMKKNLVIIAFPIKSYWTINTLFSADRRTHKFDTFAGYPQKLSIHRSNRGPLPV